MAPTGGLVGHATLPVGRESISGEIEISQTRFFGRRSVGGTSGSRPGWLSLELAAGVGAEMGVWPVGGDFGEKRGSSDRSCPAVHSGICRGSGSVRAGESDAETGIEDVCKAWALVYSLAP